MKHNGLIGNRQREFWNSETDRADKPTDKRSGHTKKHEIVTAIFESIFRDLCVGLRVLGFSEGVQLYFSL